MAVESRSKLNNATQQLKYFWLLQVMFVIFALQQSDNATLAILIEGFLCYISPTLPSLLFESYNKG